MKRLFLRRTVMVGSLAAAIALVSTGTAVAAPADVPALVDCGLILENQSGQCVSMLQNALNAEHPEYSLSPDGAFGPATRIAVLDFQGRHHLPADGNAGPVTLTELSSLTSSVPTPQPGEPVTVTDSDVCGAALLVPDNAGGCRELDSGSAVGAGKPVGQCLYEQYEKLLKDIAGKKKGIGGEAIAIGKGGLKRLIAPAQAVKCVWWDLPDSQ